MTDSHKTFPKYVLETNEQDGTANTDREKLKRRGREISTRSLCVFSDVNLHVPNFTTCENGS